MALKQRFPWIGVSAVVAFIVVLTVAGLRIPDFVESSNKQVVLPMLGLTKIGPDASAELLAERLAAYDPTPMFMPSPMNSSDSVSGVGAQVGAGGPFEALPPSLTRTGPLRFASLVPVPLDAVEGLRLTERSDAALVVGRTDVVGERLFERSGQLEAISLENGRTVLTINLTDASGVLRADWQPLELMGAVTRTGFIGEIVVTASSGSDEIDEFFRFHLAENVRLDARLRPGFYAFRVGP